MGHHGCDPTKTKIVIDIGLQRNVKAIHQACGGWIAHDVKRDDIYGQCELGQRVRFDQAHVQVQPVSAGQVSDIICMVGERHDTSGVTPS